jgi:hypothetical protein
MLNICSIPQHAIKLHILTLTKALPTFSPTHHFFDRSFCFRQFVRDGHVKKVGRLPWWKWWKMFLMLIGNEVSC